MHAHRQDMDAVSMVERFFTARPSIESDARQIWGTVWSDSFFAGRRFHEATPGLISRPYLIFPREVCYWFSVCMNRWLNRVFAVIQDIICYWVPLKPWMNLWWICVRFRTLPLPQRRLPRDSTSSSAKWEAGLEHSASFCSVWQWVRCRPLDCLRSSSSLPGWAFTGCQGGCLTGAPQTGYASCVWVYYFNSTSQSAPGKCPLLSKHPCTEFQGIEIAASIQMYIPGKHPYRPKLQVMFEHPWALTRNTNLRPHKTRFTVYIVANV